MLESVDNKTGEQSRSGSKAALVTQAKAYVRSGDYARARDLLGAAGGEFANDAELAELEMQAQDGVKRKAEADRLITESQDLFAQRKSAEAIQVLRKAYELDKKNSLARAILANALVEHAQSIVESDWLQAETLTNQALALNPAHPTAKTILNQIVEQKQTSSVEDWVSRATKLQSAGDLFAALAWVAEGLAVHPNEPKLLQMQDAIQRDQSAQKRQSRRRDLDDLKRMEREISGAADDAAKQALATRIQTVAAKHWTDGEILSIANALLLRLGLVAQGNAGGTPRSKGATLILHVPRPSAAKAPATEISPRAASPELAGPAASPNAPSAVVQSPTPRKEISQDEVSPNPAAAADASASGVAAAPVAASEVQESQTPPSKVPERKIPTSKITPRTPAREKVRIAPPELKLSPEKASAVLNTESTAASAKVAVAASRPRQAERSSARVVIIGCVAAVILVAATFFFTRKHYAPLEGKVPADGSTVSAPTASVTTGPTTDAAQSVSTPAETTAEPSQEPSGAPSDSVAEVPADNQPSATPGQDAGTLVVVAGQDDARVFINGRLQRQLTRGGQLRVANLELKDYVIRVSKNGFQDPQPQKVRIRQGEEAKLIFNLQPLPGASTASLAALSIRGGVPGTTVLVDQTMVGAIQADGTLAVASVNPGDHTIELRKDRFKARQVKKHFVGGGSISLTAADTALEPATGELKISFAPADARVALVKGDLLKMVSSGVPLNLDAGTYTLTARTADKITRSGTIEVVAGQTKTLNLSLAPNGMSKWEDPGGWKHEGDSFTRKGGDFVLYGVVPASGSFVFSAMPTKGRLLQWVLNYSDAKNYLLLEMDDNNFYRSVIRNGQKTDEIIIPHKVDKKSFRTVQIRVSPTEIIHQIKEGEIWRVLDRWTQPGTNLSQGKFGFYLPHNDQVALSSFVHYADLNIR
ncbi:MAG TPA: hypothetical protein VGS27_08340 [Candidatus Sulfotelmatobacter sp.]|nr:hypothetical protein [Candidatus Sulfotelmatobacter sp.]